MATLIMSNKNDVDQSKPFSYSPSYLKSITRHRKNKKPLVEISSPWKDSFQNPLDTLEEQSENSSSTQPEDSPRNLTELTKSKTYLEIKAKLIQIAKSRKKTVDNYYTKHFRNKRFQLAVRKVIICLRWTAFYLLSSKDTIKEAKRLYTEMQLRTSDYETVDLMFDKSSYKAKTAVRISKETRRILMKSPHQRTEEEVFRAQIALGNIKDIAQYPFRMQREIAKFGEYESFGGRRIILRQGHPPSASYFVLSGEMFELIYETSDGKPKLGQSIVKGDEFGEKAIVDDTHRECTVITKEPTELLSLKKKHFRRIFMLGGGLCVLDSEQKQFLRHLPYMKGFPIEKLEENTEKVKTQYFKKGDMITDDTRYFPWLILVKTGSVFIYKRLKRIVPLHSNRKEPVPHLTDKKKKQETQSLLTRRQMLNDIHIPVRLNVEIDPNVVEEKLGQPKKFIHPSDRHSECAKDSSDLLQTMSDKQNHETENNKYSFHSIQDQLLKRTTPPHFEPLRSATSTESISSWLTGVESTTNNLQLGDGSKSIHDNDDNDVKGHQQVWERGRSKAEGKRTEDANTDIVHVHTITNGQIFGLDDIMVDKRTEQRQSFSVFSGGADVIFIDKYFFKENMTERFRSKLVKYFCPYPSDEELQEKLQTEVDWNEYRVRTLNNTLFLLEKESRLRKSQNLF
ncbi:unnamed protein product [Mytilus coruscus]|uniref:Cyclic nucleotide-binding domain-containing protein n=1 Tax=Mytilus coruscus TaxID=42192 RepID=A0A6J8DNX9_MYTCO|nr:unnamed protein product [Mytilus coruscus]